MAKRSWLLFEWSSACFPHADSSTSVMKCIVLLAWGGELLEPDGFYLFCLSAIGRTMGTLLLYSSAPHLWARQGIIYAPLVPCSLPFSLVVLSLKRHTEDSHVELSKRCDETLLYKALLRYGEPCCEVRKSKFCKSVLYIFVLKVP